MKKQNEIYVLLDNIRSLHNVGSIFRTSDAAGIKKIFLCGQTGYPPRKDISKTAIGAEEKVSWEYFIHTKDCIAELKGQGIQLVSLELTQNSISYRDFKVNGPTCLVLGHEIDGVSSEALTASDAVIEIPMRGTKDSLNVSVAFGIAAFHLIEN